MPKTFYKAPAWFSKLYSEGDKERQKLLDFLADKTGYGSHWVKANMPRAFDLLNEADREEAHQRIDKIEVMKKYVWSRYYYQNWDKVKYSVASPFTKISYDEKNGRIVVDEKSELAKQIAKLGQRAKNELRRLGLIK